MSHSDLPLFRWQPPCKVIVFPMTARVGRVRDVACKMLDKPTQRAAEHYRRQVTEALLIALTRIGICEREQDDHLGAFWNAVQHEMIRLVHQGHGSGGGAA